MAGIEPATASEPQGGGLAVWINATGKKWRTNPISPAQASNRKGLTSIGFDRTLTIKPNFAGETEGPARLAVALVNGGRRRHASSRASSTRHNDGGERSPGRRGEGREDAARYEPWRPVGHRDRVLARLLQGDDALGVVAAEDRNRAAVDAGGPAGHPGVGDDQEAGGRRS